VEVSNIVPLTKESDDPAVAAAEDSSMDPALKRRRLPLSDTISFDTFGSSALMLNTCTVSLELESASHCELTEKAIL